MFGLIKETLSKVFIETALRKPLQDIENEGRVALEHELESVRQTWSRNNKFNDQMLSEFQTLVTDVHTQVAMYVTRLESYVEIDDLTEENIMAMYVETTKYNEKIESACCKLGPFVKSNMGLSVLTEDISDSVSDLKTIIYRCRKGFDQLYLEQKISLSADISNRIFNLKKTNKIFFDHAILFIKQVTDIKDDIND